jgi:hypothetical protein
MGLLLLDQIQQQHQILELGCQLNLSEQVFYFWGEEIILEILCEVS